MPILSGIVQWGIFILIFSIDIATTVKKATQATVKQLATLVIIYMYMCTCTYLKLLDLPLNEHLHHLPNVFLWRTAIYQV